MLYRVNGRLQNVGMFDTIGQEGYDRLYPLLYPQTNVSIICYPILDRASLKSVRGKCYLKIMQIAARMRL
jgi:GTPase SAR1 family protein